MIEKVTEGEIGRYRYIAFLVTPDEVEKRREKAKERAAEYVEFILSSHGVAKEIVSKMSRKVLEGEAEPYDVFRELGLEIEDYVPDVDEFAAEILMNELLDELDAQVTPEPGYGLPEYSLYWNIDARSWTGRWYWSHGGSEDVCRTLVTEPEAYEKINELVGKLVREVYRRRKMQLLFAVWLRD